MKTTHGIWRTLVAGLILIPGFMGCATKEISNRSTGDYEVVIWASKQCVSRGETVHLRATVTNMRSSSQVIQLDGLPVFDIRIVNGNQITRWSDGKPLTDELTDLVLEPGASKVIEMDWIANSETTRGAIAAAVLTYDPRPGHQVAPGIPITLDSCGILGY
ncbi:MAG: hypothetical protein HY741_27950 [Chloroflexi bacterium]|nr:hypothetical protein [Chloroflexota bacterium]